VGLSLFVLAPIGYAFAPQLLDFVNAAPDVKAEALPVPAHHVRVLERHDGVSSCWGGALRSAGDARTPMVLGITMTVLNVCSTCSHPRLGPIPRIGTAGARMGTSLASGIVAIYSLWKLWRGGWVVSFPTLTASSRTGRSSLTVPLRVADGHSRASR
jgi:Na+-driven multidrug efflux pump